MRCRNLRFRFPFRSVLGTKLGMLVMANAAFVSEIILRRGARAANGQLVIPGPVVDRVDMRSDPLVSGHLTRLTLVIAPSLRIVLIRLFGLFCRVKLGVPC